MEKFVVITYLYDFYQELLTQKQSDLLKDYYFEDLSLSEIAEKYNVSRQSSFDTIKKAEQKLLYYEDKLQLFKKYQTNSIALSNLKKQCEALKHVVTQDAIEEIIMCIDSLMNKMS